MKQLVRTSFFLMVLGALVLAGAAARAQSAFPSRNMALLGRWQPAQPADNCLSVWGYATPDGHEYALVGQRSGTSIVDVTDPRHPRVVQTIPGATFLNASSQRNWRTGGHYAYGIASEIGPQALQILDLSTLPDSVQLVAQDTLSQGAGGLELAGRVLYLSGSKGPDNRQWGQTLLSLEDPIRPQIRMRRNPDARHVGCAIQRDTVYWGSMGQQIDTARGRLITLDRATMPTFELPASGYPVQMSGMAFTGRGRYATIGYYTPGHWPLITCRIRRGFDAATNRPLRPEVIDTLRPGRFAAPRALMAHQDRYVAVACQEDGVRVFDLLDPMHPRQVGAFDTDPTNDTTSAAGYHADWGCQGLYTELPSGMLLAVDRTGGLFLLRGPYAYTPVPLPERPVPGLYPNPTAGGLTVELPYAPAALTIALTDVLGRPLRPTWQWTEPGTTVQLSLAGLAPGTYWLRLARPDEPVRTERIVVQ